MLDQRARILLKTLVERYIADGEPVGSRTLSKYSGLDLSPASIRNIMADLEELGLITSPHTSAGRVPTPRGYRFFVDSLVTVKRIEEVMPQELERHEIAPSNPKRAFERAASVLSDLSHFAGVVMTPKPSPVFRQIEFIKLSSHRILLILVTPEGDVQNRVFTTEQEHNPAELVEAANFINAQYAGQSFDTIKLRITQELARLRTEIVKLTQAALAASSDALNESNDGVVISGERNLLDVDDLTSNVASLRRLFDVLEKRTSLLQLLDVSSRAEGVQIFIGGESSLVPVDEMSIVIAPYEVDGHFVGALGVIGPTRMAYERVIPIVDITAKLLSSALSQH